MRDSDDCVIQLKKCVVLTFQPYQKNMTESCVASEDSDNITQSITDFWILNIKSIKRRTHQDAEKVARFWHSQTMSRAILKLMISCSEIAERKILFNQCCHAY